MAFNWWQPPRSLAIDWNHTRCSLGYRTCYNGNLNTDIAPYTSFPQASQGEHPYPFLYHSPFYTTPPNSPSKNPISLFTPTTGWQTFSPRSPTFMPLYLIRYISRPNLIVLYRSSWQIFKQGSSYTKSPFSSYLACRSSHCTFELCLDLVQHVQV